MTDLIQAIADALIALDPSGNIRSSDGRCVLLDAGDGYGSAEVDLEALAAVVEAHLRPVVTTVAELDALPGFAIIGAPVRDEDGVVAAWVPFLKSPDGPWYSGDREVEESELPELFAEGNPVVLFRPAEGGLT